MTFFRATNASFFVRRDPHRKHEDVNKLGPSPWESAPRDGFTKHQRKRLHYSDVEQVTTNESEQR